MALGEGTPGARVPRDGVVLEDAHEDVHGLTPWSPDVTMGRELPADLEPERLEMAVDEPQAVGDRGGRGGLERDDHVEIVVVRHEGPVPDDGQDRTEPEADVGRERPQRIDDLGTVDDVVEAFRFAPGAGTVAAGHGRSTRSPARATGPRSPWPGTGGVVPHRRRGRRANGAPARSLRARSTRAPRAAPAPWGRRPPRPWPRSPGGATPGAGRHRRRGRASASGPCR